MVCKTHHTIFVMAMHMCNMPFRMIIKGHTELSINYECAYMDENIILYKIEEIL